MVDPSAKYYRCGDRYVLVANCQEELVKRPFTPVTAVSFKLRKGPRSARCVIEWTVTALAVAATVGGGEVTIKPSDIIYIRRAAEFHLPRPTLLDLEIWSVVSQHPASILAESLCSMFLTSDQRITRAHVFRALHRMAEIGLISVSRQDAMIVSVQCLHE